MKKIINTKEELQKVIEEFKEDSAKDGHPNITTEWALKVLLYGDTMYEAKEIVAKLAAQQLDGGI